MLARCRVSSSPGRSWSATRRRISPRSDSTWSKAATMAPALSAQTSGQMPGWPAATLVMSRNPPAASRSRAASASAWSAAEFMRVAATRWGTWETTATKRSWSARREGHHVGPERDHHGLHRREGVGVGGRRGGEDPGRPGEQLGVRPVQPRLLGAGHGVAAHEPGVVHGRHHRGLHAAHVGHHQRRAGPVVGQQVAGHRRPTEASGVATTASSASGSSPTASSAPELAGPRPPARGRRRGR